MKRGLALFLTLLMVAQLYLPVQAVEVETGAPESESTGFSEEAGVEEAPDEDIGEAPEEDAAAPETEGDSSEETETDSEPDQPEVEDGVVAEELTPEETADQASPEEETDDPSGVQTDVLSDIEEPEASGEEEELPQEEEPRLYNGQEADYEDPQFLKLLADGFFDEVGISTAASTGTSHDSRFKGYEVQKGVDISKWNTITSWSSLAKSVDFAIIRCGNRSVSGGSLAKDPKFDEYMKAALAAGLEVGVYIYSQAITEQEARDEANFALSLCAGYSFNLPIVIDYEYYGTSGRLYDAHLSKAKRTSICKAFCEVIETAGYPAMIYANKSMLMDDMDGESLAKAGYEIWLAHWVASTNYANTYTYWQYTDRGTVSGISGYVDANYRYRLPEATVSQTYCCSNGVCLFWNKVSVADQYRIYRRLEGSGTWTQIGTVSGTADMMTYLDTTASKGKSYRYAVQACDGTVRALYDRTGTLVTYQPQISFDSANATPSGVQLTWQAIGGYDSYRIYRRSASGSWSRLVTITDPTKTSYLDTQAAGLAAGDYYYTIRGIKNGTLSSYDPCGIQVSLLSTPALTAISARGEGIYVTWSKIADAAGYCVYRLQKDNTWKRIATIQGNSTIQYLDNEAVNSGTIYTYTVMAYRGGLWSGYDRKGISAMQLEIPKLVSTRVEAKGIRLTWTASANAEKYRVYRKEGSSGWVGLATLNAVSSYLDTSAKEGVQYTYTVRSMASSYASWYDTKGLTVLRLASPVLTAPARSTENSVKVTWGAVSGANRYRVYRKTTGSWEYLSTVTTNYYVDTSPLKAGTTYYYTAVAYGANNAGSYYLTSAAYYHLNTPALLKITAGVNGTGISWSKVTDAERYYVYRKIVGGKWSTIAAVTNVTSYTDKTAVPGTTYYYTVRAYAKKCLSWYDMTGLVGCYLDTPKLKSAVNSTAVIVSWNAVAGAERYYVYRKTAATSWVCLGYVSGTSYADSSNLSSGTTYQYTVRARNSCAISGYDKTGISCCYMGAPVLRSASVVQNGIQIRWDAVSKADSYVVYRKTSTSAWVRIALVKTTAYTDTTAAFGTAYIYTVRGSFSGKLGCYSAKGISCVNLKTPTLLSATNEEAGMKVCWSAVAGAESYAVYRKTASSVWSRIATISSTEYIDTTAKSGTSYIYTVRACAGASMSLYNTTGISQLRLEAPALLKAEQVDDGVEICWDTVSGADSYIVYRKTANSGWSRIAVVKTTSYTDTTAAIGTVYTYTVRSCYGSKLGAFSADGIQIHILAQPVLGEAVNLPEGIQVTWTSVPGASYYNVYRKTDGTDWILLGSWEESSYCDTTAEEGISYTYTVAACSELGHSLFDTNGVSCVRSIPESQV